MILKIFLKELKDTLRDKRTLLMMLVIPVLVFPVFLNIMVSVTASFEKDAASKVLKIGYVGDQKSPVIQEFVALPKNLGKMNLIPYASEKDLLKDVKKDSLQIGIVIPNG